MPEKFDEQIKEEIREDLKERSLYKVVLHNDNYTTRDFVVEILRLIFHKDPIEAAEIMMEVHKKGKGVAGVFPFDIATTKIARVHAVAREKKYPLKCLMERV